MRGETSVGNARSGSVLEPFCLMMSNGRGAGRRLAPMRVGEEGREGCLEGAAERDGDPGIDIYMRCQ